jgi:hypothetical protein
MPAKGNSYKVALTTIGYAVSSPGWTHVLGGNATLTCNVKATDSDISLSSFTRSLVLDNSNSYTQQFVGATYDIALKTTSTTAADLFIRFNAAIADYKIDKDGTISLPATTTDGLITLNTAYADTTQVPTFTPGGTTNSVNLGKANGYYFLYVKGGISGRLTFTQAATGNFFIKDITVAALNQYDVLPKPNAAPGVVINAIPFKINNTLLR